MSVSITINLDNTKRILNNFKSFGNILYKSGTILQETIRKRWLEGKGADNTTLQNPKISDAYLKIKRDGTKKQAGTGRSIIDMNLTGKMAQSFRPKKIDERNVILTFSKSEMNKARGNYEKRPQMMTLNNELKESVVYYINKKIYKE